MKGRLVRFNPESYDWNTKELIVGLFTPNLHASILSQISLDMEPYLTEVHGELDTSFTSPKLQDLRL